MRGAEGVVLALGTARKTGNPIELAQRRHLIATAGEDLVRISLMADVPDDAVFWCVEDVVQGNRQFHRTEIGREMSAGLRHRIEHEGAQLVSQWLQLGTRELPQIGWAIYRIKHAGCSPLICYCEEAVAASRTVLLMPRHSSYTSLCILLSLCCLLCLALHDQIGQLMQAARLVAKLLQRLMRIAAQFFCQCLRFTQTKDRHVGRLVVSGILAGSLAERGGVRRRIKNIVDHLKRQADSAGVGFQR